MSFHPGTSPNVGVTGYTLGGGLSWLGRKYGWACNNVICDRGGDRRWGGPYGRFRQRSGPLLGSARRRRRITRSSRRCTSISFRSAEAYAGALLFPPDVTEAGVRRYRDWTAEVPEEVGSMVRMLNLPPIPDIPEEIRGKKWLAITACCIGNKEEGEKLVAPLREIGEPVMDAFDQIPAPGAEPDRDGSRAAGARPGSPRDDQRAARRGSRRVRFDRRTRIGLAPSARRASPSGRGAGARAGERGCARQARRRVRDARRSAC